MSLSRNISIGEKTYRRSKKSIGDGGNGYVYEAMHDGKKYALKVLPAQVRTIQLKRFIREIKIIKENCDLPGVPNFYGAVIRRKGNLPSYYVMELGCSISEYLKDKPVHTVIKLIGELAGTLNKLKERGIFHRDVKPENILIINNSPALCDFGLAHKVGDKRLTVDGDKQIGARMTMAPEMLRDPYNANYHQADIYSLAKTLWMLMTKDENSFDGCYNTHSKESLWNYHIEVLGQIEEMLTACTSSAPTLRWDYDQIEACCKEWIEIFEDDERRANDGWRHLKSRIFPYSQPEVARWEKNSDIISILKLVLSHGCRNHSFFPNGGGLDLKSVREAHESGCIELQLSTQNILLKPKQLAFYSPGKAGQAEQDYFLLEAEQLDFISPYFGEYYEPLTELSPRTYTSPDCYEWDDFNGEKLPEGSRLVKRWSQGKFGIFMGASIYNHKGIFVDGKWYDAYEAPHNIFNEEKVFCSFKRMFNPQYEEEADFTLLPVEKTRLRKVLLTAEQHELVANFLEQLKTTQSYKNKDDNDDSFEGWLAWNEDKKDLYHHINAYPTNELLLLNALFYAGKENRPPYGRTLSELQELFFSREELIETFTKHNFNFIFKYIEQGIEMFS